MINYDPNIQGTTSRERLEERVLALETKLASSPLTHINPNSWFFSDSLIKRSFAVMGHYTLASLLIAIPFYCLFFFLMSGPEGF